jgi:hypothetical protein
MVERQAPAVVLAHDGEGRALHVFRHTETFRDVLGEGRLARPEVADERDLNLVLQL